MERNRRDGGMLGSVAELFDLPADIIAGLPRLEMVGGRQLYLERHTGLLSYRKLTLMAMTAEELRIGGQIDGVEWVEAPSC